MALLDVLTPVGDPSTVTEQARGNIGVITDVLTIAGANQNTIELPVKAGGQKTFIYGG